MTLPPQVWSDIERSGDRLVWFSPDPRLECGPYRMGVGARTKPSTGVLMAARSLSEGWLHCDKASVNVVQVCSIVR